MPRILCSALASYPSWRHAPVCSGRRLSRLSSSLQVRGWRKGAHREQPARGSGKEQGALTPTSHRREGATIVAAPS